MKPAFSTLFGLYLAIMATTAWAVDPLLLEIMNGNHVAIMRHAIAPGTGDPPDFNVDDCSTQRNLSDEGRAQAKGIGENLRINGVQNLAVFSSEWCRCLETATLLDFGPVRKLPFLNSFFQARENEASQSAELKAWLIENISETPMMLVTHQVNISALANVYPASGEIVIIRLGAQGTIEVVGTIR